MNPRPDQPGLPDDERLRRLLEQTVAGIEPRDQLESIRSRTKVAPMSSSATAKRPWLWGALGAAVATAAVIGGFAVLNHQEPSAGPGPAGTPSSTPSQAVSPTPDPSDETAIPVYFAGTTPFGPRLYREFRPDSTGNPMLAAAQATTVGTPLDPDYFTLWPSGGITNVSFDGIGNDGLIGVTLEPGTPLSRPSGMSKAEAAIAIEQVIYTLQGVTQTRAPVQFYLGTNPVATVLGVPTAEPLAQGSPLDVLSLVNLTSPAEGAPVSGSFDAEGLASSFEANVPWQILQGTKVVKNGFFMADGYMDKLYPFSGAVDVSDLAPGTYTFAAMTDDPSGGEGPGPYTDTRTIVIE